MFDLVDIHCHALSNVDDGASDEGVMKAMLDAAYNDGIRTVCFTPHFKTYEFRDIEDIKSYNSLINDNFEIAKAYVNEKYPDMMLFLGNEIMYHNEIFESLKLQECRSLNQSSYVLIEFQPSASAYDIENAVSRVLRKGYRPVIAHIERYSALVKNPNLVGELRDMGALMQVNSRGILKFKLGKIARFLKLILKKKQVDIIASDAHDNSVFSPILSKTMQFVAKHYGDKYAERIFNKNPLAVLNNEKI